MALWHRRTPAEKVGAHPLDGNFPRVGDFLCRETNKPYFCSSLLVLWPPPSRHPLPSPPRCAMSGKALANHKRRNDHPNDWKIGLCSAPCHEPCYWCFACACLPCANYYARKLALDGNMKDYRCCQGYYGGCCTRCIPCQGRCGSCCLFVETHCCVTVSVMSTRHLVQDRDMIKNSKCEVDATVQCGCLRVRPYPPLPFDWT